MAMGLQGIKTVPTHLYVGTLVVPAADFGQTGEVVHGEHADGEGQGTDDDLPGVGGAEPPLGQEQPR